MCQCGFIHCIHWGLLVMERLSVHRGRGYMGALCTFCLVFLWTYTYSKKKKIKSILKTTHYTAHLQRDQSRATWLEGREPLSKPGVLRNWNRKTPYMGHSIDSQTRSMCRRKPALALGSSTTLEALIFNGIPQTKWLALHPMGLAPYQQSI